MQMRSSCLSEDFIVLHPYLHEDTWCDEVKSVSEAGNTQCHQAAVDLMIYLKEDHLL
jgi:hypothetical protein